MDKLGLGYKLISSRKVKEIGVEYLVKRIKCTCCGGILDFYYLINDYLVAKAKVVIIKKGQMKVI